MRAISSGIKTLAEWIHWTSRPVQEEWASWEEWQRKQSPSHYEQSAIFHEYLKQRAYFQPPQNSCLKGCNPEYYVYCFGDFAVLIISPHSGGSTNDIMDYISLLLDVYDVCKGALIRGIKGDPAGITMLRNVVISRSLNVLQSYNFGPSCYPYERIHAHTVAQYSLSTLIMRLVAHYLNHNGLKGQYPSITVGMCKSAFERRAFGNPIATSVVMSAPSTPITIPTLSKPKQDEIHGYSWPRNQTKRNPPSYLRCKICTRMAEGLWGDFEACIDCHLKRICSICKAPPTVIAADGLPKCNNHTTYKPPEIILDKPKSQPLVSPEKPPEAKELPPETKESPQLILEKPT